MEIPESIRSQIHGSALSHHSLLTGLSAEFLRLFEQRMPSHEGLRTNINSWKPVKYAKHEISCFRKHQYYAYGK